jgi:hypothetical protein
VPPSTSEDTGTSDDDTKRRCADYYARCVDAGGERMPGRHKGMGLCGSCMKYCTTNGFWPAAIYTREMQRRISMDLLMAASDGSWRGFSPYLRRVERLGYSSMFDRLVACVLASEAAKGSPAGTRKAVLLIMEIERRLRGRKLHPGVRDEFED